MAVNCSKHSHYMFHFQIVSTVQYNTLTHLRFSGILWVYYFIAKWQMSQTVKDLLKSISIWQSYKRKYCGTFFRYDVQLLKNRKQQFSNNNFVIDYLIYGRPM